jgi:hypothetical protein
MRNQFEKVKGVSELTFNECDVINGGGEIKNAITCVAATLTGRGGGGGGLRTFVLGPTLFGLARIIGVAVGCANL